MRRFRNLITYANVMASIALVLALSGTAYAAITITGRNVRDSSLTGADVKNGSLATADLAAATRRSFKGDRGFSGSTGPMGIKGLTGNTGPKGDKGDPGAPAEVVTSFASRDTGFLVRNNFSTPNPSGAPWYDYNCGGGNTTAAGCASSDGNQDGSGVGVFELNPNPLEVIALQGMTKDPLETKHRITTHNNVVVPWSNNLTGISSVSLLHEGTIHNRVECALQYANSANPGQFENLGEPQMLSAFGPKEIVAMTIVGSKNVSSGTYNVRVVCSDMDHDGGIATWRFIRGDLSVMAARNG
jgi:hypothetical protein